MSTEVNKAFVQQFSSNLTHLAQQNGSRLMGAVERMEVTGKSALVERLGATSAQLRTSRHGDTPLIDTPHSRRRLILSDYEWADLIDKQDEVRMLIDPRSDYARAGSMALGRSLDDLIIDAADGNATSVDSSDSDSNVAVANTIDEDFNTANSDIIVEKVIEAKRILMSNEVDPQEDLYFVLDSTSLHTLLQETEVGSIDYNSVKALVRGEPGTFMGFNFIQSERLNDSSESFKNCLAFVRSAIKVGMGKDINVRISERDDKAYATQVYACMSAGAVRVHEEGLVVVEAYRA
jgi:hypothetical protein